MLLGEILPALEERFSYTNMGEGEYKGSGLEDGYERGILRIYCSVFMVCANQANVLRCLDSVVVIWFHMGASFNQDNCRWDLHHAQRRENQSLPRVITY